MDWNYKDIKYSSGGSFDWDNFYCRYGDVKKLPRLYPVTTDDWKGTTYTVVYHTKWDKCFLIDYLHVGGNTAKLSAWIRDIYNPEKTVITQADKLELVFTIPPVTKTPVCREVLESAGWEEDISVLSGTISYNHWEKCFGTCKGKLYCSLDCTDDSTWHLHVDNDRFETVAAFCVTFMEEITNFVDLCSREGKV